MLGVADAAAGRRRAGRSTARPPAAGKAAKQQPRSINSDRKVRLTLLSWVGLQQAPWNLGIFFALYTAFFLLLVQPAFGASVAGQVCMGTIFVLIRQATQECYLGLSHGSLLLYRKLQFLGSATFNVFMAIGSITSVVLYEQLGRTAPFYLTAALCAGWAVCVNGYFLCRYWGRLGLSFNEVETALLQETLGSPHSPDGEREEEDGESKQRAP